MNAYEMMVREEEGRLPYYKPFRALVADQEELRSYIAGDPEKITGCACFRQYADADGNVKSVESWIREMDIYEFEPVKFQDATCRGDKEKTVYKFSNESARVPAFNEEQARLLLLAHAETNRTDSMLSRPAGEYFRRFVSVPELKSVSKGVKFDSFIPMYYRPKAALERGFYYENSQMGLAIFLLDFFLKYGFERGLSPVGNPPALFEAKYGNIYRYRFPFINCFLKDYTYWA